jgi:hypothetical protein
MELAHRADTPVRSEAEQVAFFEAALDAARRAEAAGPVLVRHLLVAGTRIELRFSGDGLARHYLPALTHLVVPPDHEPDFTVRLFDTASTGVDMAPPPCPHEDFTDRGDIWGMNSPRIRSAFHWIEFALNLLDVDRRLGVYWVNSDTALPYWAKASPLRTMLHWCLEQSGAQLLHAAALADDDGALLITGRGGVGKSTTALSGIVNGLRYLADDYLIVRLEPVPTVFSLYCTAKLNRDQVARFPELAPFVTYEGLSRDEKAVLRLVPGLEDRFCPSAPIRAIATPEFAGVPGTTFSSVSTEALHRAAAFTTMSQLPHAGPGTHDFIGRLVASVPGLSLRLGTDLSGVASAIGGLLAEDDDAIRRRAAYEPAVPATPLPLVSVVVPVYNGARFLPAAIANVLAQGYPALEIVIVDDGSTDDIAGVIGTLAIDVRYFRQDNAGPAAARNRGVRYSSGGIIAFLDVDDEWPVGTLPLMVRRLLESPDAAAIHGRAQLFRDDAGRREFLGNPAESFPYYLGAGVYRRSAFETVGLFDPDLRFGEDTDWFTRAAEANATVAEVDEVTLLVRRHEQNMTRGKSLVELNTLRLFKKALDRRREAGGES